MFCLGLLHDKPEFIVLDESYTIFVNLCESEKDG